MRVIGVIVFLVAFCCFAYAVCSLFGRAQKVLPALVMRFIRCYCFPHDILLFFHMPCIFFERAQKVFLTLLIRVIGAIVFLVAFCCFAYG